MYSCTIPVPDPGGWGTSPPPLEEVVSVLKTFVCALYVNNGLVEVLGSLGCFGVVLVF